MSTIVVMPGGFHPFHAGHAALYNSARRAFPDADVYVAATNDTSARPFPFAVKEKLAKLAGVEPGHFVQVKSPFQAKEITAGFNPDVDKLIFVRSEKDADKPPQAGGVKKDGSPSYLQPLLGAKKLEPFGKRAYMAYLPTVEFGPGMTSATEIRTAWPRLNEKRKTALVMSLYPKTQTSPALAANVVKLLDAAMGTEELNEAQSVAQPGQLVTIIQAPRMLDLLPGETFEVRTSDPEGVTLKHGMGTKFDNVKFPHGTYKIAKAQGVAEGKYKCTCHPGDADPDCPVHGLEPMEVGDALDVKKGVTEASFDREEFRRHMEQLRAREELRKTDPVAAKALDLRGALPQQTKKKPEDDSIGINDPRHPGYAYTQMGQTDLNEFAPSDNGGGRKFIPWPEFIDAVKQIVGKDFSVTEKVIKSTIQDRFIPHDPMEYGPTMLYSYYEARAGRGKGAVSTRGSIQVGKYYPNNTALGKQNFITQFSLLKGHPFERHFDLTFDNIYKIANIILGNTEGAFQMPQQQGVAETLAGVSAQGFVGGMHAAYQDRENQPTNEDYLDE